MPRAIVRALTVAERESMADTSNSAPEELATLRDRVSSLEATLGQQRQLEARLKASEELHRTTLANISDAVFVADDSGSLTFVCPNVSVIFGRGPGEVKALGNISALLGQDLFDREAFEERGEITNIEREIRDASGREHWLIVNVKRVAIQGGTVLYTCRDITDRKHVESAYRKSEARLREAQHVARMGFWDWNIVTNDLYWSAEIFRIAGLEPAEFGATYGAFIELVHPDDRDFVQREVNAAVREGAQYDIEHRMVTPAGEIRHVHEVGKVERDEHGVAVRMLGTVVDVTARVRAQEAEQEANQRARVAEELASLGTLIAGIAHDVGTPVSVILGYARMMESSLGDAKQRGQARMIAEQAKRVTGLIQTLLSIAHAEESSSVRVSLRDLLEETLRFLQEKLSKRGIEVRRGLAAVGEIRGAPDRLQQVFLNLFVNAADAMPQGGTLAVALSEVDPGDALIEISDSGPGIPEENLGRVFDPFFTTKPRGEGSGLGLVVSRRIVSEHGGTIDVSSEPGRGTRFRIRLPLDGASGESRGETGP